MNVHWLNLHAQTRLPWQRREPLTNNWTMEMSRKDEWIATESCTIQDTLRINLIRQLPQQPMSKVNIENLVLGWAKKWFWDQEKPVFGWEKINRFWFGKKNRFWVRKKRFLDREKPVWGSKNLFWFRKNRFWCRKKTGFGVGELSFGSEKNGFGIRKTGFGLVKNISYCSFYGVRGRGGGLAGGIW